MTLHEDRGRAESFGGAAERYDRSRPDYPAALFDAVLGDDAGALRVLDVGCGTGIAARQMVARGARVLGIEVDARMAEVARARGTEVEVTPFEEWDPRDRRFDRVTAAQAWHWVDPVRGADVAATALEVGGRLCVWWNVAQAPPALRALVNPVYARLAAEAHAFSVLLGSTARQTPFGVEAATAALETSPHFSAPAVTTLAWSRRYTRDEWLDQLPTHSDHARLSPEVLGHLLDAVGEAIDSLGGGFEMAYTTTLVSAERRAP
ncbi:MAG TPA: class I SAM-dependent methyltransferase [Acidimicrobiales bacterium]|nr:MAG: hypothetical protein B7Z69_07395 [Actinobacteria bacterium 21-73-9]HQU25632.1 class I SAM-dependent methyltransferase [Acidimicrobiales bacterium]